MGTKGQIEVRTTSGSQPHRLMLSRTDHAVRMCTHTPKRRHTGGAEGEDSNSNILLIRPGPMLRGKVTNNNNSKLLRL